jgi:hypothetical protein
VKKYSNVAMRTAWPGPLRKQPMEPFMPSPTMHFKSWGARTELSDLEIQFPDNEAALDGGCPYALKYAALSPKNHLVASCGFEVEDSEVLDFGDANTTPLHALVKRARSNVLLNAIASKGPRFLKQFIHALDPGIPFRNRYASVCEMCEHIMT